MLTRSLSVSSYCRWVNYLSSTASADLNLHEPEPEDTRRFPGCGVNNKKARQRGTNLNNRPLLVQMTKIMGSLQRLTVIHPTLFSTSRIELAKTVLFMIRFAHPIGWLRKIYNTKDTEMQFGHVNRGKWDDFIHVKIFHIHLAVFPGIRFKDSVIILIDCTNTFSFLVIHKSVIY